MKIKQLATAVALTMGVALTAQADLGFITGFYNGDRWQLTETADNVWSDSDGSIRDNAYAQSLLDGGNSAVTKVYGSMDFTGGHITGLYNGAKWTLTETSEGVWADSNNSIVDDNYANGLFSSSYVTKVDGHMGVVAPTPEVVVDTTGIGFITGFYGDVRFSFNEISEGVWEDSNNPGYTYDNAHVKNILDGNVSWLTGIKGDMAFKGGLVTGTYGGAQWTITETSQGIWEDSNGSTVSTDYIVKLLSGNHDLVDNVKGYVGKFGTVVDFDLIDDNGDKYNLLNDVRIDDIGQPDANRYKRGRWMGWMEQYLSPWDNAYTTVGQDNFEGMKEAWADGFHGQDTTIEIKNRNAKGDYDSWFNQDGRYWTTATERTSEFRDTYGAGSTYFRYFTDADLISTATPLTDQWQETYGWDTGGNGASHKLKRVNCDTTYRKAECAYTVHDNLNDAQKEVLANDVVINSEYAQSAAGKDFRIAQEKGLGFSHDYAGGVYAGSITVGKDADIDMALDGFVGDAYWNQTQKSDEFITMGVSMLWSKFRDFSSDTLIDVIKRTGTNGFNLKKAMNPVGKMR